MKSAAYTFLLAILLLSCEEGTGIGARTGTATGGKPGGRPLPGNMVYSYDCLEGAAANDIVAGIQGSKLRKYTIDLVRVTDEEQMRYGDEMFAEMQQDPTLKFDAADPLNQKLQTILQELLAQRTNPSGIKYSIYLLDDKEMVNAFTAGGKIFVTKAIIAQCKSDDQLYGIIGHEIGHNEKGHIKKAIQELKASRAVLGDYSETYMELKQIAGGVFNQRSEVEADYYGLGLVYTLGRNPCSLISFWHEMETKESQYNKLEDFLRSHPYSAQRAECMRRHIAQNFGENCP